MVVPAPPNHLRSRKRHKEKKQNAALTRLALTVLSFLGLAFFFIFSSSSGQDNNLRSKFHNMVERYELVGYGPTHPRAAFVLVATTDLSDPLESMTKSISSILRHTDRNRILVICAIFQQGVLNAEQQEAVQAQLDKLDAGTSTHWHGMTKHSHADTQTDHEHGHKIKAMFLENNSVATSRRDAAHYVHYLVQNHEEAGIKSPNENVISVFVRPDSEIETDHWVDTVTHALIGSDAKKTANAVSFAASSTETISEGETKSVNLELKPIKSHASKIAKSLTQGQTYPTPVVEGSVTAMTLETFLNLPVADRGLDSHFASDLEMSFNLWMCADGIDIVTGLRAKTTLGLLQHRDKSGTSNVSVARLALTWMGGYDQNIGSQVLKLAEQDGVTVDRMKQAGKLDDLPKGLYACRPFEWYTKEVNVAMDKELKQLPPIEKKVDQLELPVKPRKLPKNVVHLPHPEKEEAGGGHLSPNVKTGAEKPEATGDLPSKPLSPLNKQLISTAKFVDLAYVDVSDGHTVDPHRGALDENDLFGYIHDEKALHKTPPPFKFTKEEVQCNLEDATMQMLTKKVFVDFPAHEAAESLAASGGKPRAKIFCLVYTIEENHDRIPAIRETWGQKCDGFMVGSTKTDVELGTVNMPHEGEEAYGNIWQKVRSMWSYIYDNYYDEYDWFHIGGDDLYVLVENLRLYVESEEIQLAANGGETLPIGNETKQLPLFLGRRFKEGGNDQRIFNSGGSGYTMNKAALKALVVDGFPTCMAHLKTFAEDVMVAQCFRTKLQVFPFDTKDENGGERYMPFQPKHHLNYQIPADVKSDWYANYSIDIKTGLDHCAARSVAFHYIKGPMMKRLHAILYGHCA